jgi:succinate dehydrogenase/fumarate reductase-like Fe-S protein
MTTQSSFVHLQVTRGDPEHGPRVAEYDVAWEEGMSLLDALHRVREEVDPSLAVRFSCRSANACKECVAQVDGRAAYLCVTKAPRDASVRIEPLPRRAWLRDLAVELEAAGRD